MEWQDAIIREKKHGKSKVDDCNLLFCLADLFTSGSQKGKEKSRMEAGVYDAMDAGPGEYRAWN